MRNYAYRGSGWGGGQGAMAPQKYEWMGQGMFWPSQNFAKQVILALKATV